MTDLPGSEVTVYVVDDNQDMREGIEWMLTSVGYFTKSFRDAESCLSLIQPRKAYCIVVDSLMPGMTGLQFCRQVFAINHGVSVIMISAHGDVMTAVEAMKVGVFDFFLKPFSREHLLNAVNGAVEQAKARQVEFAEEEAVAQRLQMLTSRERAVMDCVCEGMVTKQIANKLEISSRTVDVHRASISAKLGIQSPMQLSYVMMLESRRKHRPSRSAG